MNNVQKRAAAAGCIGVLIIGTIAASTGRNAGTKSTKTDGTPVKSTETASESRVKTHPADLTFWYNDESYKDFYERAAEEYYEETGSVVDVRFSNVTNYLDTIYDATMNENAFPDVYMIEGDRLEKAYLYGLAAENTAADIYESSVAENAISASVYRDKMYGYPLSYNVCLLVYQNGYFQEEPKTVQSIIDYSNENEPPENIQYLLEWDVNDAFYDYVFVSNSVRFEKNELETMKVEYDEQLYQEDLDYFSQILESFSIDAGSVTEESVVSDFNEGTTLCAIIDSDSLSKLTASDYSAREILPLNDSLDAGSAALTDMVIVNEFSEKKELAADFAEFVTLAMSGELHGLSGHYSVRMSEDADDMEQTAYQAYENATPAPDSQDANEFWVTLKETISKYF